MPNWTPENLDMLIERVRHNMQGPTVDPLTGEDLEPDPGPESKLASKIVAHAKDNGWPCLYFPQSKKVRFFLPAGWPDVTLVLPRNRTVFLELKSAKGTLGDKQRLMCNMFRMLHHEYYKCTSFKRYLEIVERKVDETEKRIL